MRIAEAMYENIKKATGPLTSIVAPLKSKSREIIQMTFPVCRSKKNLMSFPHGKSLAKQLSDYFVGKPNDGIQYKI